MKKILEQVKNRDFDVVRVILLSQSFAFNLDIQAFKKIKDEKEKEQAFRGLVYQYRLPKSFILNYTKNQSLNIDDLETQLCVHEVYDSASDGERNVIDQEGIYIKFDPDKTDRFYKSVIKRLRSSYEFFRASEKDIRRFTKEGGRSPYLFNADKKAHQKRKQHGSNFEEDVSIYLACEKAFTEINDIMDVSIGTSSSEIDKEDAASFVKNAIDFAAEKLKIPSQRAKDIYYEVCNRYHLPTITKNPPLPSFLGKLVNS